MSKDNHFKFHSSTVNGGGMKADFDLTNDEWKVTQDVDPFLRQAAQERELVRDGQIDNKKGYQKFATIPDIVAIDINEKYGIDIHDPETMQDRAKMARFMIIVKQEYPYLLSY